MPSPPGTDLSLASARSRGLFAAVLFFSVFTNLLMLTGPLFMLQVYDRVLGSRSEETLVVLLLLATALYGFYALLDFARGRTLARIGARVQEHLGERIFAETVARTAAGQSQKGGASLADLDALRTLFTSPVLLALFDIPWTPLFLAGIFLFHPDLGLLAIAGGGVLVLVTALNQLITRKRTATAASRSIMAQRFARDAEKGSQLIRGQGMTGMMTARWSRLQDRATEDGIVASDWTGTFTSFTKAFRLFLQSAMLALGAWLVLRGEVTSGAMIASSILLGRALAPIEQGLGQWPVVQRGMAARRNLKSFLSEAPSPAQPMPLPAPEAELSVQNVTVFDRPGGNALLRGISFDLAPGEALGVIGRSGSGKSTLARVLLGQVQPAAGEVRLAAATLSQYGSEQLGQHIGWLPQDVRLFDGTVAENIAHMALTPDPERVVAVAQLARVHEIILKLPEGYDTRLGDNDARLSGGQMQRLALARALYHDPVLLVLDEPNSALDAEGSEALNHVVMQLKAEGKSVIIMTHRPTAIAPCDRLLVLEGGGRFDRIA